MIASFKISPKERSKSFVRRLRSMLISAIGFFAIVILPNIGSSYDKIISDTWNYVRLFTIAIVIYLFDVYLKKSIGNICSEIHLKEENVVLVMERKLFAFKSKKDTIANSNIQLKKIDFSAYKLINKSNQREYIISKRLVGFHQLKEKLKERIPTLSVE
jgi:hypothetical protein